MKMSCFFFIVLLNTFVILFLIILAMRYAHFSYFFPLTMFQCKHIGLLKEKMDSLINEHMEIIDSQEKQQFKWANRKLF